MAHFYGTIKGSRGLASRLGTASSGLTVKALSWQGGVTVSLYHNATTGEDMARVELRGHPSHGGELRRVLYDGPVHPEPFTPDYANVVSLPASFRQDAGCDRCGTNDRAVGSYLCADCEGR